MRRTNLFGRDVKLQGSPWTLLEYREAFGGDLTYDFSRSHNDQEIDVEFFMRAAWAMAKTYDNETSEYITWLYEFPSIECEDETEAEKLRTSQTYEAVDAIIGVIRDEMIVNDRPKKDKPSDATSGREKSAESTPSGWEVYTNILILKRLGFSEDEIRRMSMRRFIAYTDLAYGNVDDASAKTGPREATQSDIDKFFG